MALLLYVWMLDNIQTLLKDARGESENENEKEEEETELLKINTTEALRQYHLINTEIKKLFLETLTEFNRTQNTEVLESKIGIIERLCMKVDYRNCNSTKLWSQYYSIELSDSSSNNNNNDDEGAMIKCLKSKQ